MVRQFTVKYSPNLAKKNAEFLMDRQYHKDSFEPQAEALAQNWLGAYDRGVVEHRKATPDYKPTLYKNPSTIQLRGELPDRFMGLKGDPLASKAISKSLDQIIKATTDPQSNPEVVLKEARGEAQKQFARDQKQLQNQRRKRGVSHSGGDLLHSILASQQYINNFAQNAQQLENQRQEQRKKALYDLANYALNLEKSRGDTALRKAEQQSKMDAIEADLFNKQNTFRYEQERNLNRENTQLKNQAQQLNQQIKQQLADKNVEAAIQQKQHFQDVQQRAFRDAYQQQLNRARLEFDRLHKLLGFME